MADADPNFNSPSDPTRRLAGGGVLVGGRTRAVDLSTGHALGGPCPWPVGGADAIVAACVGGRRDDETTTRHTM